MRRKKFVWLPKPLERILDPFLEPRSEEIDKRVRALLEDIRRDPYHPGHPCIPYRGQDLANAYVVIDGELWICYQVFRDHPWIALVNVLEMIEGGPTG